MASANVFVLECFELLRGAEFVGLVDSEQKTLNRPNNSEHTMLLR